MAEENEIMTNTIAETPNFIIWSAQEADGEETFHIELGLATIHFFEEEWDEFLDLIKSLE